jgi:hypothetical protein
MPPSATRRRVAVRLLERQVAAWNSQRVPVLESQQRQQQPRPQSVQTQRVAVAEQQLEQQPPLQLLEQQQPLLEPTVLG